MTANKKIEEAEYNFKKMILIDPINKEFAFELSNFLCSTRGILDHLLAEYATKYGIRLIRTSADEFKTKASKMKNNDALHFIGWYSDQFKKIRKDKACDFLMDARDLNVHQDQVRPRWMAPRALIDNTNPKKRKIIDLGSLWFFEGYHDQDARDICRQFLDRIISMVILAHSVFP